MNTSLYDTEHQAKENLEKEFQKLILRHSMFSNSRMELDFKGLNSIRSLIDREAKQLDDLISKIREEEKNCDEYLQNSSFPVFLNCSRESREVPEFIVPTLIEKKHEFFWLTGEAPRTD